MGMDWNKFHGELDALIDASGTRTDKNLAGKISTITRLTDEDVKELFPNPADVKKLAALMEIVKRSGDKNEKVKQIVANAGEYGGVIYTLLGKLA